MQKNPQHYKGLGFDSPTYNPFLLTPEQRRCLRDIYDREEQDRYVWTPQTPREGSWSQEKLNTIESVQELNEKLICTGLPKDDYMLNRSYEKMWGKLSDDLRNDKESMIFIMTRIHPGAICAVPAEQLDKQYIIDAISRRPDVYSCLPFETQKDKDIINAYFNSTICTNQLLSQYRAYHCVDNKQVAVYTYFPRCSQAEAFPLDKYKEAFKFHLTNNLHRTASTHIPECQIFVATARELYLEKTAEFDQMEREAFSEVKNIAFELASRPYNGDGYRRALIEFGKVRGIPEINEQQLNEMAIMEFGKVVTDYVNMPKWDGFQASLVIDFMDMADKKTVNQYIDVDAFWQKYGALQQEGVLPNMQDDIEKSQYSKYITQQIQIGINKAQQQGVFEQDIDGRSQ